MTRSMMARPMVGRRLTVRMLRWARFVLTPQVYPSRWQDRLFRGHLLWGPITIYGANAMHWAVDIRALGHWWCMHPTTHTFGGTWPWYFYVSRDGTPHTACYKVGGRIRRRERQESWEATL